MAASLRDIQGWLSEAQQHGASHMIVVCDTWDYDDYPVFVMPGENAAERAGQCGGNMQKVMEVYNLGLPLAAQLAEHRAWHVEPASAMTRSLR